MGILRSVAVVAWGTIVFSFIGVSAAQATTTPCGVAQGDAPSPGTNGLWLVEGGSAILYDWTVYDSNLGVCWLADGNLAAELNQSVPSVRDMLMPSATVCNDGITPTINPDGTMDYPTALIWVCALNSYKGTGWLNHTNWQLPATLQMDPTCSSVNVDNFGIQCTGSALSNLYYVGLKEHYPDSLWPPIFTAVSPFVPPFFGLQPGLYWASDTNPGAQATFSFNTGQQFGNTTVYNLFHVLPMSPGMLAGDVAKGTGVVPYTTGSGAGLAVYDKVANTTWPLYGNLAAINNFGVTTPPTSITSTVNGVTVNVPPLDSYGDVYYPAVGTWIAGMNSNNYAGSKNWALPSLADLRKLYADMNVTPGDALFENDLTIAGPFISLQRGFYWACVGNPNGPSESCDASLNAPQAGQITMEYSFNFDDGFLGTDQNIKQFYVEVYYPAPAP